MLEHNQITKLEAKTLAGLKVCWTLYLSDNPLAEIHQDAFDDLENLEYLALYGCRLKAVDSSWFKNLKSLVQLELQDNLIEEFDEKTFKALENLGL